MIKPEIFLLILCLAMTSCCGSKSAIAKSSESALYDTTWELEYLSESQKEFKEMYPDRNPFIQLKKANSQFSGNTGCNDFGGTYHQKVNAVRFEIQRTTMAYCESGGEEAFLKMLSQINRFAIDNDGKLLLLTDDVPMMRFKKINPDKS